MLFALRLALPLAVIQGFQLNTFEPFGPFAPLFGGNKATVQYAVKAINDYYAKQGDTTLRTYLSVLQSEYQTSDDTHYKFTLRVAAGSKNEICHVGIVSTSGGSSLHTTTDPVCYKEYEGKRQVHVTLFPVATDDPEVQRALNFAVDRLNAMENFMFLRTVTGVDHVTSQIVGGNVYHFAGVQMTSTSCDKMSQHQLSSCPAVTGENANTRTCDFEVWHQTWVVPEYQITNIQCT